jgi:hypothetical protein
MVIIICIYNETRRAGAPGPEQQDRLMEQLCTEPRHLERSA